LLSLLGTQVVVWISTPKYFSIQRSIHWLEHTITDINILKEFAMKLKVVEF
jgi:hypothetical protein